jgi:hypothetical protein
VVVRNEFVFAGSVMAVLLCVGCSDGDVPLRFRVPCEAVLTLRIGDEWDSVLRRLGETPSRTSDPSQSKAVEMIGTQPYDAQIHYGRFDVDHFETKDSFSLQFFQGELVHAFAGRSYGDSRRSPDGTNPRHAFYLRRGPDGAELREIGPAFNDVFGCDPPVTIPALK